jgi:hypothetical protein
VQNEQNGNSENGSASSLTVNNPFLRCDKDELEATKSDDKNNDHEKDPEKQTNNLFKPVANLFANAASSALSENSNFVFGQNLRERVVMVRKCNLLKLCKHFNKMFLLGQGGCNTGSSERESQEER